MTFPSVATASAACVRAAINAPVLRSYQREAASAANTAWCFYQNVMVVLPTGAGKTVFFAHMVHEHPGAAVAVAHRQELVEQISMALAKEGVRHRIIAPDEAIRAICSNHTAELGVCFYDANAQLGVASVNSMRSKRQLQVHGRWLKRCTLWVGDECHHFLAKNSFGHALEALDLANPTVKGLMVTATPCRADGKGLGRQADGLADFMHVGPRMIDLINWGYLTRADVVCPKTDIALTDEMIGAGGDYVLDRGKGKAAVRESGIVGDTVDNYLKWAPGKLAVVFASDLDTAADIAKRFRERGVPAEMVDGTTPGHIRRSIINQFRAGQLRVLVNVDLFGEGFDLPAIECVIMARATKSFSLYCLDPLTEVLTPQGWLSAKEALNSRSVIAFDMTTGLAQTVPVTNRVKRPLLPSESMFRLSSPQLDITVSDQHRLVYCSKDPAAPWLVATAADLAKRKWMWRVPIAAASDAPDCGLSTAELHFLGWFLADGGVNRKTQGLTISQSVAKTAHRDHIREALTGCGFRFTEAVRARKNCPPTHSDLVIFTVSKGAPRGAHRGGPLTGWGRLEQWVDKSLPEIFDTLSRRDLLVMLEAWNLGDGLNNLSSLNYNMRTLRITCGDNKRMADRLQALCVVRGLKCNIATSSPKGTPWHMCYIKDADSATVAGTSDKDGQIGKKRVIQSRLRQVEYRPEFVWCLTNELGTLITRRNGKVAVVGNCQQWGRALRLMIGKDLMRQWDNFTVEQRLAHIAASPKPAALIIDQVGNLVEFRGPPDAVTNWTLDRRDKRSAGPSDAIPTRNCLNPTCLKNYRRIHHKCPYCGMAPEPSAGSRGAPKQVDGDLALLDPEILEQMRQAVAQAVLRSDADVRVEMLHKFASDIAIKGAITRNQQHQAAHRELVDVMAWWAGQTGLTDVREIQRLFWFTFGVDMLTPQSYSRPDMERFIERVEQKLTEETKLARLAAAA